MKGSLYLQKVFKTFFNALVFPHSSVISQQFVLHESVKRFQ